jgi:tryptophanyl-tRNA synthetase
VRSFTNLIYLCLDDEKFIFKSELKLEETRRFAYENAKDIIACGFDPDKTFIFMDTNYVGFVSITLINQTRNFL